MPNPCLQRHTDDCATLCLDLCDCAGLHAIAVVRAPDPPAPTVHAHQPRPVVNAPPLARRIARMTGLPCRDVIEALAEGRSESDLLEIARAS